MHYLDGPQYQHDCESCRFQGHYNGADWYVCLVNGPKSVIKRYSSEESDYWSMPYEMVLDSGLKLSSKDTSGKYLANVELAEARAIVEAANNNLWLEQYALAEINNDHATSG